MVRVSQVFFNVLVLLAFFVARSLKKVKSRKSPCLVSLGSVLLLFWSIWFYWQVHHFGFLFGKVKKQPCAGHMTSTWPRWLPCKSHLEKFNFIMFFVKCIFSTFQVHSVPIVPVTFKITCQSSQGHLLSKKSIDFLRHCSCLLGKVKDKVSSAN